MEEEGLKFAIVAHWYGTLRGGVEDDAQSLASALRSLGHSPSIFNRRSIATLTLSDFDGIVVEGVYRRTLWRLRRLPGWSTARKVLFTHGSFYGETHPELAEETGYRAPLAPRLLKRLFDSHYMALMLGEYDRVFTLSRQESIELGRVWAPLRPRIQEIALFRPRIADAAHETTAPRMDPPYVVAITRIHRRKNLEVALRAVRGTSVRFRLAGVDDGDLPRLKRLAMRLGDENFEYLGPVSDVEKVQLIRGATATVIPSYFEGIPKALLESISLGVPVICTKYSYAGNFPGVTPCAPDDKSFRAAILSALAEVRPQFEYVHPADGAIAREILQRWSIDPLTPAASN